VGSRPERPDAAAARLEYVQPVDEKVRELLQDAFSEAPSPDANAAISRMRRERGGGNPDDEEAPAARSYEIILTAFDGFARDLLPKLVYHMESIGAHLPACRGVVISAFVGERLYFVEADKFLARACRILGVTADELVRRYGTGEQRTAVRPEPLLLPGPKGVA
jgi:hypothetical protein